MSRFARAVALASTLGLAVALLAGDVSARADDDKEIKKAQKDVLDLAKLVEQGKESEVAGKAATIKKSYEDLNTVMHVYKPSPKGGIGFGKPAAGDGIELKVIALGKRALPPATLKKEKDDLVKMAYINIAMAEVAAQYAPAKPKGGKGAKEWKQYASDQKKASLELIKAAQAGDPAKVKAAANNINNACNNCHSDFRDS